MRSNTLIAVLSCAALAAACGGDDSDGGNADNTDITVDDGDNTDDSDDTLPVDAPPTPDAPTSTASEGIGKICDQMATPTGCPASAPICASLGGAQFCTATCGSTAEGAMEPPANGNATCQAVTPPSPSGTTGCFLTAQPSGGTMQWACGIACGTFDNMGTPVELGDCPTGLTCTENICQ